MELDDSGIYGIDYGAKINDGNQFSKMENAIVSLSTYSTGYELEIGDPATLENEFTDNNIHILAEASDKGNKLIVTNNNFNQAGNIGVVVRGESRFEVINNSFQGPMSTGVLAEQTATSLNFINCN